MISLENLKKFLELQQEFVNSEYLTQATSLGSIFDTMMFPDYDNAINLVDVKRKLSQDINFDYEFTENGFLFYYLFDSGNDAAISGTLTTEKGEVFKIDNRCTTEQYGSYFTFFIPVLKGMKLHIGWINSSVYDGNRISFLPLKEIE